MQVETILRTVLVSTESEQSNSDVFLHACHACQRLRDTHRTVCDTFLTTTSTMGETIVRRLDVFSNTQQES